jgi:hypothetical protein
MVADVFDKTIDAHTITKAARYVLFYIEDTIVRDELRNGRRRI